MSVVRPALFLYVETDPAIRVWTGPTHRPMPGDDVDVEGGEYLALALSSFPVIDRLLDDQAGEYDLTLSSLEPETLALLDVPSDISGARAHIGQLKADANWRPIAGIEWLADYDAESVSWSLVQAEGGNGHTASVALRLGSASTDRRLASLAHWSPVEQAILSSTDRAFEFTPSLSVGTTRQFPA